MWALVFSYLIRSCADNDDMTQVYCDSRWTVKMFLWNCLWRRRCVCRSWSTRGRVRNVLVCQCSVSYTPCSTWLVSTRLRHSCSVSPSKDTSPSVIPSAKSATVRLQWLQESPLPWLLCVLPSLQHRYAWSCRFMHFARNLERCGYSAVKKNFCDTFSRSDTIIKCDRQTDGRMDRQTDKMDESAISISSVAFYDFGRETNLTTTFNAIRSRSVDETTRYCWY